MEKQQEKERMKMGVGQWKRDKLEGSLSIMNAYLHAPLYSKLLL